MENLGNPANTISIIQKYDFIFQKKYGQNFLIDNHVLSKIINSANIGDNDLVIEIGPGIGTLTSLLAKKAKKVIAIEIDKNLIPILNDTLSEYSNIELINDDVLNIDFIELLKDYKSYSNVRVVANLPYYITTPIIMNLFESHAPINSITIMIQKEVASRILASPSTKDYGALSLAVNYYASANLVANVPPNCFMPRPNVASAVITLTRHTKTPFEVNDEALLFKLIRAAFMQRRKTLQNAISNSNELSFSKDTIILALEELKLSPTIRGEALSLEDFCNLANTLSQI